VALAQMGIVEVHTWNSTDDNVERPNRLVWESDRLAFARDVSEVIARTDSLYTTTFAKAGRERKILIDYLRNNRTNTSVSAFSPRARPGATVSTPLDWNELTHGPERWTVLTVPVRLARLKTDPWAEYWSSKQKLTKAVIAAVRRL
jgi:bifunctional non-homologous end joining protein LigD